MPRVVIVDYGSGNLRSVQKSVERVAETNAEIIVSSDPNTLRDATHIILPGVGAFADCMRGLMAVKGLRDALEEEVQTKKKWLLGICVGMQLLFERGHEFGVHEGLGWMGGEVVRIDGKMMDGQMGRNKKKYSSSHPPISTSTHLKIPHMGWNDLIIHSPDHPILKNIHSGDHAYFVHSYHAQCHDPKDVIATTEYGAPLTAIVARGHIMGTQFHPEKSQQVGLTLLSNFLAL